MREKCKKDAELFDAMYESLDWMVDSKKNPLYAELEAMDKLLDEMPQILELVQADLLSGAVTCEQAEGKTSSESKPQRRRRKNRGRPGEITCEQALRCALLKQYKNLSYRELAHQIAITPIYRKFTRFYSCAIPHFSTIERVVKRIGPATMEKAIEYSVRLAMKKGVEDGRSVRQDSTVVESDIVYPLDSRLLNDSVRVLTRLLYRLQREVPECKFVVHDRTRRSKKRSYQIVLCRGKNTEQRRKALYKDLLGVHSEVLLMAERVLEAVGSVAGLSARPVAVSLMDDLQRQVELGRQVHSQTYRRVLKGEKIESGEKVVSIFETHTDIIRRGKSESPTEFGHKVDFGIGRSGLVVRCQVLEGNPVDSDAVASALKDYEALFGKVPEEFTADRGYFSSANEELAHEMGVKKVALAKRGKMSAARERLQRQPWFRRLMRFRAGIEGCLSTLLRSFGLTRCLWKGWQSFQAYVGVSVFTYNLRLLAGHVAKT